MNAPVGFKHERRWNRNAVGEPVEWGLSADKSAYKDGGAQLVCDDPIFGTDRGPRCPEHKTLRVSNRPSSDGRPAPAPMVDIPR